ncbi:hypothetical protein CON22_24780 [Bacillus cereus]|nr:hypothetical protein CON22_24780 [Bacillus cereus]
MKKLLSSLGLLGFLGFLGVIYNNSDFFYFFCFFSFFWEPFIPRSKKKDERVINNIRHANSRTLQVFCLMLIPVFFFLNHISEDNIKILFALYFAALINLKSYFYYYFNRKGY